MVHVAQPEENEPIATASDGTMLDIVGGHEFTEDDRGCEWIPLGTRYASDCRPVNLALGTSPFLAREIAEAGPWE